LTTKSPKKIQGKRTTDKHKKTAQKKGLVMCCVAQQLNVVKLIKCVYSRKSNLRSRRRLTKRLVKTTSKCTCGVDAAPPSQGTDPAAQEKVNTMWAFYGKQARMAKRDSKYTREDVEKAVKQQFLDADVHMMCDSFLKVRKADLATRRTMDDAILAAYEKGKKAHATTCASDDFITLMNTRSTHMNTH
jgi:hypothetical protein